MSDDTDQLTDSHVIPNDKSQEFNMLSPNSEDSHLVEADSGRFMLGSMVWCDMNVNNKNNRLVEIGTC